MRDRMQNFMNGRYGNDQFNKFLTIVALVLILVNAFTKVQLIYLLILVILVYVYFRTFSRNIGKRYAENEKFLQIVGRLTNGRFGGNGNYRGYGNSYGGYQQNAYDRRAKREQDRLYRFFVCPHCSQKVRVPKGKGKIQITCPKCRTEFIKRT